MAKRAKIALIVVDVQNDFCPGGALAVPDGDEVVTPLNKLIQHARVNGWLVVITRDWHPEETSHFDTWPVHCVRDTRGAEFHSQLDVAGAWLVSKGIKPGEDAYSAFDGHALKTGQSLLRLLRDYELNCVYVGGLATDYCVKATAIDAVTHEFKTLLLADACRAMDIKPDDGADAIKDMQAAGVILTTTQEVINGRRPAHH
ncbi:MAG: isochorismatase family protein [bacterium]|nr:isochorismatase family protein [bacterium]